MIELNELSKKALEIANKRKENDAKIDTETVKMLKHCATEVVEATEAFVNYKGMKELTNDGKDFEVFEEPDIVEETFNEDKMNFAFELGDIISCALIIGANENIDIEKVLLDCVEKNRKRAEKIGDKL